MSACWASESVRRGGIGLSIALLSAVALTSAGPAWARVRADSSVRVSVGPDGVRIDDPSTQRKIHLKGDMHVGDRHIVFDDSADFAIPSPHARRSTRLNMGPGIHIESDEASVVRMGSDIVIDSTEIVDDAVVALFGNITVRGRVEGDVVAVLGSITLEPGSIVDGDAVAVGGSLDQAPDATVHGQSVSLSFLPIGVGIPPLRALAIALFVTWLAAMLSGLVLALVFHDRMIRVAQTVAERAGWSLLFGILLPPLTVIAGVLLMVTVIGIPIAFLLPLIYVFMLWAGTAAAAYLLGCRAMGRELGGAMGAPLLVGTLIVGVLFGFGAAFGGGHGPFRMLAMFFPLLGLLLATSLAVIGSGAVLVSRFGTQPKAAASPTPPYAGVVPGVASPPAPPPGAAQAPPAAI